MTSSGEISSTGSSIVGTLSEVGSTFSQLTGEGKWQGDSMEGLLQKVQSFVGEATSIIQSKVDVLSQFAEKYEEFADLSKQTQPIRDTRCQHCKTHNPSSSESDGCHFTIPVYDEEGNIIEWLNNGSCGPWQSAKSQVESNVQQMDQMHQEGESIKSSFPSSSVSQGEGIEPFSDYGCSGSSCGSSSSCSGSSCGSLTSDCESCY